MYLSKATLFVQVVRIVLSYALGDVKGHNVHSKDKEEKISSLCVTKCQQVLIKDRTKCLLRCGIHGTGKSARIRRSSENDVKIAPVLRTRGKRDTYCGERENPIHGLKNPNVPIRQMVYTLNSKNKTIVHFMWDQPAECKYKPCKGYLVIWALDFVIPRIDCLRVNKNVTNFTLDASTGFDGRQGFAINVFAFPYQSDVDRPLIFKTPPPPEKLAKPLIIRFTTENPIQTTSRPNATTNFYSSQGNAFQTSPDDPKTATTLIPSVSVITVVIFAIIGLVAWRMCRKREQKPTPKPNPKPADKMTIYVSYLPEKTSINEVREIYSWLKSHNIDVVMDQMYDDQKLYYSLGPKRFGERFLTQADKVIMIVTNGYLKICRLDDTFDIEYLTPCFKSLNEERLYSEVTQIKTEVTTTLEHGPIRFIPILVNVPDNLPQWLQKLTSIEWPEKNDRKTETLLNLLKGNDQLDC